MNKNKRIKNLITVPIEIFLNVAIPNNKCFLSSVLKFKFIHLSMSKQHYT